LSSLLRLSLSRRSQLQAAVSLSKSDGNVPIHIQLLQIGGDPAAEQRGAGRGGDLLRPVRRAFKQLI
jgi:hypothetical protein